MKDDQNDIEPTGEDNIEEIEIEEIETSQDGAQKKLRQKLKQCEQEKMQSLEDLQRTKAEFLNARKRIESQKEIDVERSISKYVEKLLPLCDSFQMAMANKELWESVDKTWREGVESIQNQLQTILTSYGVTIINPEGEQFNPEEHEAMTTTEADEGVASETVIQVLQFGYKRNDELIRPAKVILSK